MAREGYFTQSTDLGDQDNFNRLLWQVSDSLSAGFVGVIRVRSSKAVERDNGSSWTTLIGINLAADIPSLRTTENVTGGAAPFNHDHYP